MKFNKIPKSKKRRTPIQAIKFYCKHSCCSGQQQDWKYCPAEDCALYPYRLGKRPKKKPFSEYMKPKSQKQKHTQKALVLTLKNEKNSNIEPNRTHPQNTQKEQGQSENDCSCLNNPQRNNFLPDSIFGDQSPAKKPSKPGFSHNLAGDFKE